MITGAALGHGALAVAASSALLATASSVAGHVRRSPSTVALGRRALTAATVSVGGAVVVLAAALVGGDFSLAYVADASTRATSRPLRLAGLWGGMEGSLLLWTGVLLGATLHVARQAARRSPHLAAVTQAAGAGVGVAALAVVALAADPFQVLAIPAIDGGGLVPVLEHPAMLYHPPLLYAGHAGLVGLFALALAGLATGRVDSAWLAQARRAALVPWLLLGAGLLAGAHWAYAELGWGGYWAWDPVENSGLLPWLGATAFLHVAMRWRSSPLPPVRRLGVLAALPFLLSLMGAALTRSGAVPSVHAFAEGSTVGWSLLGLLVVATATVAVLAARAPGPGRPASELPMPPFLCREWTLGANTVVVLGLAAAVAFGTLLPLGPQVLWGERLTVTGRYFAVVTTPLAVVLLVLMGIGPSLSSGLGTSSGHRPARRPISRVTAPVTVPARRPISRVTAPVTAHLSVLIAACTAALLAGVVIAVWGDRPAAGPLAAAAALAAVLTAASLVDRRSRRRAGGLLAHLGAAVLALGVAGSMLGREEVTTLRPGQEARVGRFTIRHGGLDVRSTARFDEVGVRLGVAAGSTEAASLRPSRRSYRARGMATTETAMLSTLRQDLLIAVRSVDPATGAVVLEVFTRPLMVLVWWGGVLVLAGGVLALSQRDNGRRRPKPAVPVSLGRVVEPYIPAPHQ